MGNRRGMSPLIATVLLMAFAVALGGMIMNWTAQPGVDCSGVAVEPIQFCYDADGVTLHVRNTGEEVVDSLSLSVEGSAGEFTLKVPNSRLPRGETVRAEIPFGVDDSALVRLFVFLSPPNSAAPVMCETPVLEQQPLPRC